MNSGKHLAAQSGFLRHVSNSITAHDIAAPWGCSPGPGPGHPRGARGDVPGQPDSPNAHSTYQGGHSGWGDTSGNLSYAASGSSMDWGYDGHEVFSTTIETFIPAAAREGWPTDVNFWGQSATVFTLKLLMNTDLIADWQLPEREFPYPAEWTGVHYYPEGAPGREGAERAFAPEL